MIRSKVHNPRFVRKLTAEAPHRRVKGLVRGLGADCQ